MTDAAPRDDTRVVLRRCAAYLIDVSLIAIGLVVVVWATGGVRRVPNCNHVPQGQACFGYNNGALQVNNKAVVWFLFAFVVMLILVIIVPQALAGTSAGKATMGIRVVRRDGSPPGALRSTARLLLWGIDGLALLIPVALWSAMFTPGHRRVGDFVAGTFVLRHQSAGEPVCYAPAPWQRRVRNDT